MIWQDSKVKGLIANNQTFTPVPDELLNKKFFIWDMDLDIHKDRDLAWSRFTKGQRTIHTKWVGEDFNGRILLNTLEYGNTISSFDSMFTENAIISVLVKESPHIGNQLVTVGNDKTFFMAKYFPSTTEIDGEFYSGKVELINIRYFIENIANDGIVGLPFNITIGNWGERHLIPKVTMDRVNNIEVVDTDEVTKLVPTKVEVFIPEAAGILGVDFIEEDNRVKEFKEFKTDNLEHYKSGNKYDVLPTQFKIFSVDNYGIANQADTTNAIKALMFTQTLSQVINTASKTTTSGGGALGLLEKGAEKIIGGVSNMASGSVSLGSSFFSDRSVLSTQSAIATRQLDNDSSFLKFFLEADMLSVPEVIQGNLDLTKQDNYEVNRSKGTAESTATTLLPEGIDPKTALGGLFKPSAAQTHIVPKQYNMLGTSALDNKLNTGQYNVKSSIPFLLTPESSHSELVSSDTKLKEFLEFGTPRKRTGGTFIGPMISQDNWDTYIRSNVFRPDAYSWWNWPIMYPSAVTGIYNTDNLGNSVTYDSGLAGNAKTNYEHWTAGITVGTITNNDVIDPRAAYTSFGIDFDGETKLTAFEGQIITASQIKFMVMDDNGNQEEYIFSSTGATTGSASDLNQIFNF